jgi:hypothetical protein
MPKLLASLLTLLVALVYGVGAAACPGGVAMPEGVVCALPSEVVCAGQGGHIHAGQGGAKQMYSHGASTCQTCEETECCGADHTESQVVTVSMARERWVPVLFAAVTAYLQTDAYTAPAAKWPGPAEFSGVRASDLALLRSTYLLI